MIADAEQAWVEGMQLIDQRAAQFPGNGHTRFTQGRKRCSISRSSLRRQSKSEGFMEVLNAKKSSEYFDASKDEREDSAVRVIHWGWLEHSSTLGRLDHLEPESPLDMLVLYQAAAATFKEWNGGKLVHEELNGGVRVINLERAKQRLQAIPDAELTALATRFASRVVALSDSAAAMQDLEYYVELFLRCVQDKRVIDGILSGTISRESKGLTDINLW